MKNLLMILSLFLLTGCNQNPPPFAAGGGSDQTAEFSSEQKNGKWTTDFATAQELKGMHNTIDNFTLLNKKKFENLKAYQEFGELMMMQTDRVASYCRLDPNTKNLLCKKLDAIKSEAQKMHGENMDTSKEALKNINAILAAIDSTFAYMN